MYQSLKWILLVTTFAFLPMAKAEFEETVVKQPARVIRPTVVCAERWPMLNDELKKLQDNSYKVTHFATNANPYTRSYCLVVEPAK